MEYDAAVAERYGAYRPPLHEVILDKLIKGITVEEALDIGCGTGNSTRALLTYAERVVGLEPSASMLALAPEHPNITYIQGELPISRLPDDVFGICAMAGSINYCHTEEVLNDIVRISADSGYLLVYDFYIPLAETIGLSPIHYDYNHSLNWDDMENSALEKLTMLKEGYSFKVSREQFMEMYKAEDGAEELSSDTVESLPDELSIEAVLFGTKYQIRK